MCSLIVPPAGQFHSGLQSPTRGGPEVWNRLSDQLVGRARFTPATIVRPFFMGQTSEPTLKDCVIRTDNHYEDRVPLYIRGLRKGRLGDED